MDTVVIFAITGCLFSAAVVYVVLDYYRHGERQEAMENVLSVQAKVNSAKKVLQGYTKFTDFLDPAKQAAIEKMKSLTTKVVRDYVLIEKVPNEAQGPKAVVTVIVKYTVEYIVGYDLKPENLELLATTAGIDVKLKRPVLFGSPFIKTSSHDTPIGGTLENEKEVVKAIYDKLPALARQYGTEVTTEEALRALCEKKLLAVLSSFLTGQPGVAQVPVMAVVYI